MLLGALGTGTASAKQLWQASSSLPSVRLVRAPNDKESQPGGQGTNFGLLARGQTRHHVYVRPLGGSEPSWGLEFVQSAARVRQDRNPTDQQSAHACSRRDKQGTPEQSLKLNPGWHHTVAFSPVHLLLGGIWVVVDTTPGRFANGKGVGS